MWVSYMSSFNNWIGLNKVSSERPLPIYATTNNKDSRAVLGVRIGHTDPLIMLAVLWRFTYSPFTGSLSSGFTRLAVALLDPKFEELHPVRITRRLPKVRDLDIIPWAAYSHALVPKVGIIYILGAPRSMRNQCSKPEHVARNTTMLHTYASR